MRLEGSLKAVSAFAQPEQFADIRKHVDPAWVAEALAAEGTATVRKRRLPVEQVVWLVVGMAMFRKWPIHDLVGKLNLVLPGPKATVAPSAVAEARTRVGAGALERIFEMGGQSGRTTARASTIGMAWLSTVLMGCVLPTPKRIVRASVVQMVNAVRTAIG